MTNSSIARACGLIGVGFVACLASAKEVTLTISNVTSQPIVAYLDKNGVWTLDEDGSPCTKDDLAEGDTLTVSCGVRTTGISSCRTSRRLVSRSSSSRERGRSTSAISG